MAQYSALKLMQKLKARGLVDNTCVRVVIEIDVGSDWVTMTEGGQSLRPHLGEVLPSLIEACEPKKKEKKAVKPESKPVVVEPKRHALKR